MELKKRTTAQSGFGEPGEVFIFDVDGVTIQAFVTVRWDAYHEQRMWETWAYEIDDEGERVGNTLWQYSTPRDIRADEIREDIEVYYDRIRR